MYTGISPNFRARELAHCIKTLAAEFSPWNPHGRRRKVSSSKPFSNLQMFHVHPQHTDKWERCWFPLLWNMIYGLCGCFESRFFTQHLITVSLLSIPFRCYPPTQVHTPSSSLPLEYKQAFRKERKQDQIKQDKFITAANKWKEKKEQKKKHRKHRQMLGHHTHNDLSGNVFLLFY